ncbi:hypothetical protein QA601_07130 [Chitinispirillales bacterium ANBcel5]|uniref:hypothetical protein n=1 Tax=Cellulosispirillum alkaliphilum TaxID=3039283 RepID=UPI002A530EC4|nr:hypothetical protein [Chitinispirillales bacterium ANBcel5]
MQTAIRIKKKIESKTLRLDFPEIDKLMDREVEIIILVDGKLRDDSTPHQAVQNSTHVAGSTVLDQEAIEQILQNRLK